MEDPRVITAARLGYQFSTNPFTFLSLDADDWQIARACGRVVNDDIEAAKASD